MSQKNYFMLGAVTLVVLTVGYFLIKGGSHQGYTSQNQAITIEIKNPSPTLSSADKISVEYINDGFIPKNITVKLRAAVTWTNKSNNLMWVASAPHPSHSDYPEFDQLKGVGKDSVYVFTFDKVGTWKYHNHLRPSDTGIIVVEK